MNRPCCRNPQTPRQLDPRPAEDALRLDQGQAAGGKAGEARDAERSGDREASVFPSPVALVNADQTTAREELGYDFMLFFAALSCWNPIEEIIQAAEIPVVQ